MQADTVANLPSDPAFSFSPATVTIASNGNPFLLNFVQPGAIAGAASLPRLGCPFY